MSDEYELNRREVRARRAAEVLEHPLYQEAWDALEKSIHDKWADSPIADHEGQHELRLMLHIMKSLRAQFDAVITDGKIAALEKQTLKQRVANMFHR